MIPDIIGVFSKQIHLNLDPGIVVVFLHPDDTNQVRRQSSNLDELRRGHRADEDKLEAKVKELKMELEDM